MHDDKWFDVLNKIESDFDIEEHEKEPIEDIPRSERETVVFVCPIGKYKFIREMKPKVLDKKTHYSNRVGGDMSVEYIYSEMEYAPNLKIYKWDEIEEDWMKASLDL